MYMNPLQRFSDRQTPATISYAHAMYMTTFGFFTAKPAKAEIALAAAKVEHVRRCGYLLHLCRHVAASIDFFLIIS
jgi:hypothetical protein